MAALVSRERCGSGWCVALFKIFSISRSKFTIFWFQILTLSDPRMSPFLEAGEICGAGLTVRETARGGWTYKFSIWNSNAENTISKLMIG